jgi:hypothetical protein
MSKGDPDYIKKLMQEAQEVAHEAAKQLPAVSVPLSGIPRTLGDSEEAREAWTDFPLVVQVILTILLHFVPPHLKVAAQWQDQRDRDILWIMVGELDDMGRFPPWTPSLSISVKGLLDAISRH